ncbi:RhoGAP domain-containing protein/PBD domain-containing protein [Cephalotus follicularis]|uniref:RhoGAP domain-containing protein/PBD domain-containing protein n=1 Tax=Cephalotus follicularis TaxID=3775 RepID=A0A1Q3BC91_CEPFO|nr:RhoGAP domain-containing protein/PBD domain-containing protein [Cephalotus follicularis]
MTEVLHSPSHFPSSPSTNATSPSPSSSSATPPHSLSCAPPRDGNGDGEGGLSIVTERDPEEERRDQQLSLLALLVAIFRKSLIACKSDRRELCAMEIGLPTNVRHVAHVTFDRFNGFLGLPVEFEPDVPRRAPSASATVFGVSTESMQLSYDSRGNSVPTILLLMQRHLYAQGGLQAEGIFRINAENSQEEYVRDQLNRGVIPEGIDIHCLAGLIKAWFRELPAGVLDSLSPEQVIQCQTEEECVELVSLLPPTEASLLDWAINLMTDVVQQEHQNKMNARNIAMVFAPNMTQMADPLTALMYAVQLMNFLKTLILRTLRERENSVLEPTTYSRIEPSDESGHQSPSQSCFKDSEDDNEETEQVFVAEEPVTSNQNSNITDGKVEEHVADDDKSCDIPTPIDAFVFEMDAGVSGSAAGLQPYTVKSKIGQSSISTMTMSSRKINGPQPELCLSGPAEKMKGISNLSRIDSRIERIEAWR